MEDNHTPNLETDLHRIVESAQRLGIELNEAEALAWLAQMASQQNEAEITHDPDSGIFGHKVVMLDFSQAELARFRAIGKLVEFENQPGRVETALALSGSSAQSKIQSYPGDSDYFERVNIIAPTRAEACQILADIMRAKALSTLQGPTYQLIEVKFGNYPFGGVRNGRPFAAGTSVAWSATEVERGQVDVLLEDEKPAVLSWEQVSQDPGWCKLDWVVADPLRGQLANASNMLDVTWEAPDGSITPLDGYLDPYFQEIYLESESVPIFSKLSQHVSADALDTYVEQLENEVRKYLTKDINFGKAAKRMYNIFRLTGRYEDAVFLRELFDEPTTLLYQVWSLIRTIDDSVNPGSTITKGAILSQTDQLILSVVETLEGGEEAEIVRLLLRLRSQLSDQQVGQRLSAQADAARAEVINVVNNFFYEKLSGMPAIKTYMEKFSPI